MKQTTQTKIRIFILLIILLFLIGEVKCVLKAFNCNWEPIGKAEIVYTGAALTGCGCVVGWINIEDK
jgi:hypothetical protein